MTTLSHEQAIQCLHEAAHHLSADQQSTLAAHLAECEQCRTYADQLTVLQPLLTQASRARRYPNPADGKMVQVILQHKRRSTMRKQTMAVAATVVIAAFAIIAISSAKNSAPPLTGVQETTAAPPTPVGTLLPDPWDEKVDIGVAKLHVRCLGQGSPTVVLNGGPGEEWSTWQRVMQEVAKFTRVCAYDRAGLGESSRGPKPRTSQQMAEEFAALLEKAKIPGPYVLVSHSTSNWIDRLYTAQHRDQVAALVFVSPFHEDMISGTLAILAPYPADLSQTRYEMSIQGEGQSVDDLLASADQVRAAGTLGSMPLVLLARGKFYPSSEPYAEQIDAMLAQQEQQLLALSTNSMRLVADQSGHFIQRDQPQAVVDAIRLAISSTLPLSTPTNALPNTVPASNHSQNFKLPWTTGITHCVTQNHLTRRNGLGLDFDLKYETILAPQDGTVTYAGWNSKGGGNTIIISHAGGITSTYMHLSLIAVKQGAQIRQGQPIGAAGDTGDTPSPLLHFHVEENGRGLEPIFAEAGHALKEGDCVTSQNVPRLSSDRLEPNDDFDQATPIDVNMKYDLLDFAPLTFYADGWDSDYFKVRVKPGMLITCRTLDLSPGTDTNLILYDNNQNGIEGQDDVDRARNDLSSSVTYTTTYEGWLYVLVGEGFSRTPAEAQQATYSLECSTEK